MAHGGKEDLGILLRFLRYTKEGMYAPIEESSLSYARLKEETNFVELCEEEYYYNVS
ncbi:MAG: hypothetical protein A4E48_00749 [Methanosaeta sp. PtaU1.Bin060]|nr:MAG: hypothetical protein A4E48_00749 [Methanosaeta sp. PtaU1.Bin060]